MRWVVELAVSYPPSQPRVSRLLTLKAYLLGTVPLPEAIAYQRRLAYDVGGDDRTGAVIFCEHPPGVTIGRHGSRIDVLLDDEELADRGWLLRWLAVGGGAMLHVPGQVACYPVLPLGPFGQTPADYVAELARIIVEVVASFGVMAISDENGTVVRVAGRRICQIGVAVRNGITAGGVVLNVQPDLTLFRSVRAGNDHRPMTSLQRECPHPVRPAAVRQRLLDALTRRFATQLAVFHHHPCLPVKPARHAFASAPR